MNELPSSPTPPNFQTELAKERNHIAANRTLLAWIRTSVALIGVGFGVEQVIARLYEGNDEQIDLTLFTRLLSLSLVALGIFTVSIAALDYQAEMRRLQQADYIYSPRPALGMMVAGTLAIIALGGFIFIFRTHAK